MSRIAERALPSEGPLTLSNATTFTSSGNWVAPAGVTEAYLTMCGGGGGGRETVKLNLTLNATVTTNGAYHVFRNARACLIFTGASTNSKVVRFPGPLSSTTTGATTWTGIGSNINNGNFVNPTISYYNCENTLMWATSATKLYIINAGGSSAKKIYSTPVDGDLDVWTDNGATISNGCFTIASDGANNVCVLQDDYRTTQVTTNDGSSWTTYTNALPAACNAMKYMNGRYIAWNITNNLGSTQVFYESTTGQTWTTRTMFSSAFWNTSSQGILIVDIVWTGTNYVAGGYYNNGTQFASWAATNTVLTSTWTQTLADSNGFSNFSGFICPSAGVLIAQRGTNYIHRSVDNGATWLSLPLPASLTKFGGSNGRLYASSATGGNPIYYSADYGLTWISVTQPTMNTDGSRVRFVVSGDSVLLVSDDAGNSRVGAPYIYVGPTAGGTTSFGSLLSTVGGSAAVLSNRGAGGSSNGLPSIAYGALPAEGSQQKYTGYNGGAPTDIYNGGGGGCSVLGLVGLTTTAGTSGTPLTGTVGLGPGAGDYGNSGLSGGGGAEATYRYRVPVVPTTSYSVVIGQGGSVGATAGLCIVEWK